MLQESTTCRKMIFFKRWTRKSFAVFASLGKTIHIGVLLSCCSMLVIPVYTYSQNHIHPNDSTEKEETLEEVVVSASKAPQLQSQLMRVVQIISRAEIERSPADDIASLLEYARGVDIRERGSMGMQADISIRGGSFEQTLILLNGINISDPQSGHHNLNIPVDFESIERIEILQGAGARMYGPNAFNGAVNIITKDPGEKQLNISLTGGQYSFASSALSGGFNTGPVSHFIAVNGKTSDGFIDNTDFKSGNIFYNSDFQSDYGKIDAQAGYNNKAFGANSFYTPLFPNQFEQTTTLFLSLAWQPAGKLNIKPTVYWRQHTDRFELFRYDAPDWYNVHNYHLSNVVGAKIKWFYISNYGKSSAALDYRHENIFSNVIGLELQNPKKASAYDDVFYTKYYDRTGISLMLEHNIYLDKISISGGVLTYYSTALENDINFFPGIDVGWEFFDNYRFVASANRTLRLPSFTEMFYNSPAHVSNPFLQPEKAYSVESGFANNNKDFSIEANAFRRWGLNMIDWVMFEGDTKWQSMNHTNINVSGFELFFKKPLLFKHINNQYNSSLSLNYTYIFADKHSREMISQYALDYMKHKLDVKFALLYKSGGLNINIGRRERAGGYMLFEDGAYTEKIDFKPFWMTDIKIFYTINKVYLSFEVINIFDVEYVDIANVPQAGRWAKFGLKYSLSYDNIRN